MSNLSVPRQGHPGPAGVALSPQVLMGAAHELGHALVDLAVGFAVLDITYDPATGAGLTTVDVKVNDDTKQEILIARLTGCVAGYEAEVLWAERYGLHASREPSCTDFRRFRQHRWAAELSETTARTAARVLLRRRWGTVERLAPVLAAKGRLSPAALITRGSL